LLRDVTIWVEPAVENKPWLTVSKERVKEWAAFYAFYVPLGSPPTEADGLAAQACGGIVAFAKPVLLEPSASMAREIAPGWLLHEFAHALHDRRLGLADVAVAATYRQAMDRKLYEDVQSHEYLPTGGFVVRRSRAYADENPTEYFAELSAAYLGIRNRYFPFTRDDLRKHDPAGYALMEKFWRSVPSTVVNELAVPVSVDRVAETGRRFRLFDLAPGQSKPFDAWDGMGLIAVDQLDGTEYKVPAPADARWRLR